MKKTNRKWIEGLIHTYANTTMTRDEFSNAVVEYIERRERKSERRGAKHESKRWSKKPIWSESANGTTTFYGTFETLKPQPEPAPAFDKDEVRGLIDAMRDFAIDFGAGRYTEWCMNEALRRLLAALHIED